MQSLSCLQIAHAKSENKGAVHGSFLKTIIESSKAKTETKPNFPTISDAYKNPRRGSGQYGPSYPAYCFPQLTLQLSLGNPQDGEKGRPLHLSFCLWSWSWSTQTSWLVASDRFIPYEFVQSPSHKTDKLYVSFWIILGDPYGLGIVTPLSAAFLLGFTEAAREKLGEMHITNHLMRRKCRLGSS